MNNCVINNSYSEMGALLYSHDNAGTPSYIFNCQFYENKGDVSLFDLYTASVILYDSIFFNNSNLAHSAKFFYELIIFFPCLPILIILCVGIVLITFCYKSCSSSDFTKKNYNCGCVFCNFDEFS